MAQPSYLVKINFSLTEAAQAKIRSLTELCRVEENTDPIATISWGWSEIGTGGEYRTFEAPLLGWFVRGQLPEDAVQNVAGLEIIFNVTSSQAGLFQGRFLHFDDKRGFVLVDEKMQRGGG